MFEASFRVMTTTDSFATRVSLPPTRDLQSLDFDLVLDRGLLYALLGWRQNHAETRAQLEQPYRCRGRFGPGLSNPTVRVVPGVWKYTLLPLGDIFEFLPGRGLARGSG
jgi:hypothetical protein